MSGVELDIVGVYIKRDLKSPAVSELLSHDEVVTFAQQKSCKKIAELLLSDIRSKSFLGSRSIEDRKRRETLPTSPLAIGLARSMLFILGLENTVRLIPAENEKNKKRFGLTGDLAAATSYEWVESPDLRKERNLVGSLQEVSRTASEARERLINANLRLVVSIAKTYPERYTLKFPDYIGEGNIGLIHAVDKFDWRTGNEFSTYATTWIKKSIYRAIQVKGATIYVPVGTREFEPKVKKAKAELIAGGIDPTVEEVAAKVNEKLTGNMRRVGLETVEYLLFRHGQQDTTLSLESYLSTGKDSGQLFEVIEDRSDIPPEEAVVANVITDIEIEALVVALSTLTQNERNILTQRFDLDRQGLRSQDKTRENLGITIHTVRNGQRTAKRRLREMLERGDEGVVVRKDGVKVPDEIVMDFDAVHLGAKTRDAIYLLETEGLSPAEVAERLGVTVRTIYNMRSKARRKINQANISQIS